MPYVGHFPWKRIVNAIALLFAVVLSNTSINLAQFEGLGISPREQGERRQPSFAPIAVSEINVSALSKFADSEESSILGEQLATDITNSFGLSPKAIDSISIVYDGGSEFGGGFNEYTPPSWCAILRTNVDVKLPASAADRESKLILKRSLAYDKRTLLYSQEPRASKWVAENLKAGKVKSLLGNANAGSDETLAVVSIAWQSISEKLRMEFSRGPDQFLPSAFSPLLTPVRRWEARLTQSAKDKSLQLSLTANCIGNPEATDVSETLQAMRTLLKNILKANSKSMLEASPNLDDAQIIGQGIRSADEWMKNAKFTVQGSDVTASASVNPESVELVQFAFSTMDNIRKQQTKIEGSQNLRQIMLALLNYESAFKRFPARVIKDPSGQVRSWRIEILPFLEENDLFQRYRRDEPWDSEANLAVLRDMPKCFSDGSEDENYFTSYVVVEGEGYFLETDRPVKIAQCLDGTSNTVGVIETTTKIPWTKPEDISSEDATLAALESPLGDLIQVGMVDCSVLTIRKNASESAWQKLLKRADGEYVDIETLSLPGR